MFPSFFSPVCTCHSVDIFRKRKLALYFYGKGIFLKRYFYEKEIGSRGRGSTQSHGPGRTMYIFIRVGYIYNYTPPLRNCHIIKLKNSDQNSRFNRDLFSHTNANAHPRAHIKPRPRGSIRQTKLGKNKKLALELGQLMADDSAYFRNCAVGF